VWATVQELQNISNGDRSKSREVQHPYSVKTVMIEVTKLKMTRIKKLRVA